MSWIGDEWHKAVIGLLALDHLYDRLEPWFNRFKGIERRIEDRRKHMNLLEVPTAVEDTINLIKLIQEDWAVVAPQNPALIAMAEKVKTDWEKALGINDIAAPMAPPTPPAA